VVSSQALEDIQSIVASVLIFLGIQVYLGVYISAYPWAFIAGGIILFWYRRKLAGAVTRT
jgi:hypothetical protein